MHSRSARLIPLRRLMLEVGRIAGVLIVAAGSGHPVARAAIPGPAGELSPDLRPVLVLQPPQGPLLLAHPAAQQRDHKERSVPLPAAWQTSTPDRGFNQALLMQLSPLAANWPWRTLIVSGSGPESDRELQSLTAQAAVIAVVRDSLEDLGGKVQFRVTIELSTVRAIATAHERRERTRVEYLAPALPADSDLPRRSLAGFATDGVLDEQVNTAATDLSQFLATIVARVSVPNSLHPHNPTLGGLGLHLACAECRASNRVVYLQPGRVWLRVGKPPGRILALPLPKQTSQPATQGGHAARTERP